MNQRQGRVLQNWTAPVLKCVYYMPPFSPKEKTGCGKPSHSYPAPCKRARQIHSPEPERTIYSQAALNSVHTFWCSSMASAEMFSIISMLSFEKESGRVR